MIHPAMTAFINELLYESVIKQDILGDKSFFY